MIANLPLKKVSQILAIRPNFNLDLRRPPGILCFIMLCNFSYANSDLPCGQEQLEAFRRKQNPNEIADRERIMRSYIAGSATAQDRSPTVVSIPIKAYIVQNSAGFGGISECEIKAGLEQVNHHFSTTDFSFFYTEIEYMNSDQYYSLVNFNEGDDLYLSNNNPNAINIYFVNYAANLCGWAEFPATPHRYIVLNNACVSNTSSFAHEIGHYFGLLHTHSTSFGTEMVDGSNCSNTGDLLCDTPADPNLSGKVNSSCNYTGSSLDLNGDLYVPDPDNMMSYSRKSCRTFFSSDQINRMNHHYNTVRAAQLSATDTATPYCPCISDSDGDGICDGSDVCPDFPDVDMNVNGLMDACEACEILDFSSYTWYDFEGQDDGDEDVLNNGAAVRIESNGWKAIRVDYTFTSNTVIEFDFRSLIQGEIHEIAFDDELIYPPMHEVVLYGTEGHTGIMNGAYSYTGNGAYQHFTIPIGTGFTGFYSYLIFASDQDTSPEDGNSYFRNFKIYEDIDNDLSCDAATFLPVELTAFTAKSDACQNTLSWTSETEFDFDYYEIERSDDGKEFISQGLIMGEGGDFSTSYTFTDKNNGYSYYYRLKMVDLDGSFEYSEVIFIKASCNQDEGIRIYPNPVFDNKSEVTIEFYSHEIEEQLLIYNQLGKLVKQLKIGTLKGKNRSTINLSDLSKGIYFMKKLESEEVVKFIVL